MKLGTPGYYDANGTLMRKAPQGQGAGTVYIGGVYEKDTYTGEVTKYYFAAGARIAMRKGGALSYLVADHLGGTALVTDGSGAFVGRTRYYPYGTQRTTEGTLATDKLYTGQQQETTNGIYHYKARLYNADIGRMPQADPIIPERENPQAYNGYSFMYNAPTNWGYLATLGPNEQQEFFTGCRLSASLDPVRPISAERHQMRWDALMRCSKDFYRVWVSGHVFWTEWPFLVQEYRDLDSRTCRLFSSITPVNSCRVSNTRIPFVLDKANWYGIRFCGSASAPLRQVLPSCATGYWFLDVAGQISAKILWPW
jgi:RHS repeat-associated protein